MPVACLSSFPDQGSIAEPVSLNWQGTPRLLGLQYLVCFVYDRRRGAPKAHGLLGLGGTVGLNLSGVDRVRKIRSGNESHHF